MCSYTASLNPTRMENLLTYLEPHLIVVINNNNLLTLTLLSTLSRPPQMIQWMAILISVCRKLKLCLRRADWFVVMHLVGGKTSPRAGRSDSIALALLRRVNLPSVTLYWKLFLRMTHTWLFCNFYWLSSSPSSGALQASSPGPSLLLPGLSLSLMPPGCHFPNISSHPSGRFSLSGVPPPRFERCTLGAWP